MQVCIILESSFATGVLLPRQFSARLPITGTLGCFDRRDYTMRDRYSLDQSVLFWLGVRGR